MNCDSSSFNEEKRQQFSTPLVASRNHEPPPTFGIGLLGRPVHTCLDLPLQFYTWLRQHQICILCTVKWTKDFPHQSRGKLLEVCSDDCAYHRTSMKAARTRHCRHRRRMGRGITLLGSPADRESGERRKLPSGVRGRAPAETNLVHLEPYYIMGPAEAQCTI